MKRSKLQVHVAILQTLANYGKLIPTHITYNAYLNCNSVNECLGFLVEHNLVKELNESRKRRVYDITDSGLKALRLAQEIDKSCHVFNVT